MSTDSNSSYYTVQGEGYYTDESYRTHIRHCGVDQDWWILEENWEKLLNNLRTVNFNINSSSDFVSRYINQTPRDLPANLGARFPDHLGTLGQPDYKERNFYRVTGELKASINKLPWIANLGWFKDIELNRPNNRVVAAAANGPNIVNDGGGGDGRSNKLPVRDGVLQFGYILDEITNCVPKKYDRFDFETEFQLTWVVANPWTRQLT